MERHQLFLSCEPCGFVCALAGTAARAIADDPPSCPGCGTTMVVSHHRPRSPAPRRAS